MGIQKKQKQIGGIIQVVVKIIESSIFYQTDVKRWLKPQSSSSFILSHIFVKHNE